MTTDLHVVSKHPFPYPSKADQYAAQPVPSLHEFEQLWAAWDVVSRHMIPEQELHSKPIKLRNACVFYLGHIPAFFDIHLTRATGDAPTKPAFYQDMFERGIDPDVDNPENCHAHSEIPDEWPPTDEIVLYQQRVRERTRSLFNSGVAMTDRKIGRALFIGFEHEVMHLETLLYMLLQSDKTRPPPGGTPDFEVLAKKASEAAVPNDWIKVPASTINIGMNDPENDEGPDRYFGWDNEKPQRTINVPAFEAQARPLTNEDYALFLEQTNDQSIPASWMLKERETSKPTTNGSSHTNGNGVSLNSASPRLTNAYLQGKFVRTVYGPVPLEQALDWPIFASYDELARCAAWMNARIPTFEEARSIYRYVDTTKNKDSNSISEHPSRNGAKGDAEALDPNDLFRDLEGCNVGFKNFCPVPVTQNGGKLAGQGGMGGVWEWTSSVLEKWDEFEIMGLYPGYTSDFFDGKHNIVLGGSWATHPRIAGRKSFVNWYQRNYPYAWCGARLARDTK
ncbi:L-histidine Nalpha-methyltransferase / hercynylcysteine S-oxide synthase, partial [Lecanoromycetidae sp. Uapishka_2]